MKRLATAIVFSSVLAGGVLAGQMHGHGTPGRDWNSGLNVYLDMPITSASPGASEDPDDRRCREVRHICFGRFGVNEPQYGNCVWRRRC